MGIPDPIRKEDMISCDQSIGCERYNEEFLKASEIERRITYIRWRDIWNNREDIIVGYFNLLRLYLGIANKKIEKLAKYRNKIMMSRCRCIGYYIKFTLFGKQYNWIPYCKMCGCIKEAKIRSKEAHCPYHYW